jgi:C1A family cysteine protease
MKKRKWIVLFVLPFTFIFLFFVSFFVSASDSTDYFKSLLAPINPDFLKYMENAGKRFSPAYDHTAAENRPLQGSIPSPIDLSHVKGTIDEAVNNEYPARYDLRELNRVTSVKDQDGYPTCWIFAAFTSLESCLLPDEHVDFSEWHMAVTHGFDYIIEEAGNSFMTTAYLIRWSGPVNETDVPYASSTNLSPYYPLVKHVQQVVFLPKREGPLDNNTVKYFLMNDGPVDFAFFWTQEGFSNYTNSFYLPNNGGQNHRLAIVGWDDNYPASRFAICPPGDGAFIARNSWGSGWGEAGYCYMSYYDGSFQQFTSFNSAEAPNNYGTIYQYDPLGQTRTWGKIDSWGANVFTAESKEPLEAVGFYSMDANMNYEIHIYKNITGNTPTSGTLAFTKTGGITYPGYYTIKLDTPVPLTYGETFSVVVQFTNSNFQHSVPIETQIPGHSSAATANPGESYISEDGILWEDLTNVFPNANVCIKAYARYKKSNVSIQAERKVVNGWIIIRHYGEITIHVENLQEVPLSKLILYRESYGTENETEIVQEIYPDELVNGTYTYKDKYLERTLRYTYHVVAVDLDGVISSKSNLVCI